MSIMPSKGVITLLTFAVLGIVLIGLSIPQFAEADRLGQQFANEYDDWVLENSTNGTVMVIDEDAYGDIGFSFYVKADLKDDDGNGIFDHCDQTHINVTGHPQLSTKLDSEDAYNHTNNGGFYFMVAESDSCQVEKYDDDAYDGLAKAQGLLRVGRACYGCYAGEMTFSANQTVWVSYDDEVIIDFIETTGSSYFASLGFLCSGLFSICCGVLIFGVSLMFNKNDQAPVMIHQLGTHPIVQHQVEQSGNSEPPWALGMDNENVGK